VIKRTFVARSGNRFKLNDGLRENVWLDGQPTCSSLFPLLTSERTLRSWRTWIGIPMLVLMALQYVLVWETGTAWSVLAWGLTILVLAGIGVQGLWNAQVVKT
ncbi:MAG: hypothetical protein HGA28_04925, partial [Anaerolineaceae bacterium]|nr:hypothetical protein [Anaerolineaceae bacterium]